LLYSPDSQVRLEKVSFDQRTIAMGLKAEHTIPAATAILSTCTSMSLDLITDGRRSISVIESSRGQLGPLGPRLLLGPLRFANHDCKPNCHVQSQLNVYLYVVQSTDNKPSLVRSKAPMPMSYGPSGTSTKANQ
jgi:hypothetical protein